MSLLKYLERAERMDYLIQHKATGHAEEFAHKLGISRSLLMEHLRDLKELGAPIRFSEIIQSYYYESAFRLIIREKRDLEQINGGFFSMVVFAVQNGRTAAG